MKKSLIVMAVAAALPGVALAESSVQLFGVMDAGVTHQSQGGSSMTGLTTAGETPSLWGMKGTEDLGGGLKASFWLESLINATNGTNGGMQLFERRSTVDLSGNWGAIRLGRDYVPTFENAVMFDPFGAVGAGTPSYITILPYLNITGSQSGTAPGVFANNQITYLYNFGANEYGFFGGNGLTAKLTYSASNNSSSAPGGSSAGSYVGGRLAYFSGPFYGAIAYGSTNLDGTNKLNVTNLGAWYDLGAIKPMFMYGSVKSDLGTITAPAGATSSYWSLAATAPLGKGTFKVSYSALSNNISDAKTNQFSVGYVYNLSKTTALYGTASALSNKNGATGFIAGGAASGGGFAAAAGDATANATAFDLGIRHAF
jgi:predicted porin